MPVRELNFQNYQARCNFFFRKSRNKLLMAPNKNGNYTIECVCMYVTQNCWNNYCCSIKWIARSCSNTGNNKYLILFSNLGFQEVKLNAE